MHLCKCRPGQAVEHFRPPAGSLIRLSSQNRHHLCFDFYHRGLVLPVQELHISGIISYVLSISGFFHSTSRLWDSSTWLCVSAACPFQCYVVFCRINRWQIFVYSTTDGYFGCLWLGLLWTKLPWASLHVAFGRHMNPFLWLIHLGVELLGYRIRYMVGPVYTSQPEMFKRSSCFTFLNTGIVFFIIAIWLGA